MSDPPQVTSCSGNLLDCGAGAGLQSPGTPAGALFAALAGSAGAFAAQLLVFLLLRIRLKRIYRPRSYLVPERERVPAPPRGIAAWLYPLFTTPNLAFIQKCGLDAYFFLRYLRMLLKFFLPVALIVMPIMLPLNRYSGNIQQGLDKMNISNVAPEHVGHRLWAHLIMAVGVIIWFCYIVYTELRGYIRVRQAFLTSPQHRLRASATTVLVPGIPRKWLTLEALSGLYDVFPGGIKNIWINRNFDELSDKVNLRDKVAKNLEGAETDLIKKCRKAHEKKKKNDEKKEGAQKKSKSQLRQDRAAEDADAERMAQGQGLSAGDQHTTPHGLQDLVHEAEEREEREQEKEAEKHHKPRLGIFGEGLDKVGLGAVNQGLGAVGHGFGVLGKGVGILGQRVVGDVDNRFRTVEREFNHAAEAGTGFVTDDELYRHSVMSQSDGAPTPPPKTPTAVQPDSPRRQPDVTQTQPDSPRRQPKPHPMSLPAAVPGDKSLASPAGSEKTAVGNPEIRTTRPSAESKPRSQMQIEEPDNLQPRQLTWKLWKNNDKSLALPSPQPHMVEEDEFPLTATSGDNKPKTEEDVSASKLVQELLFWKKKKQHTAEAKVKEEYPESTVKDWDEDQDGEPRWRHYIEPKDRDTMRLPAVNQSWFPSLPFMGQKVDKIYYLRRELARLNLEIEADQNNVEKYPYMNSAFIQFNQQVAAHMACQSLSHHLPLSMAPREIEISPTDVIWDNMSIKWWERDVRTGVVVAICAGLIIFYAIPVTFTSLLAHLDQLATRFTWLSWVVTLSPTVTSIIQGLLPPILLSVILILVPIIFRLLVKQQGVPTGSAKELGVQTWYFTFLFIQVFFVVTLSSGLTVFLAEITSHPDQVIKSLAESLPRASNYFFQYLLVQALSNSASALLQIGTLFFWFIWAPISDATPRQKWRRQVTLSNIQWGSFFPPFTNFAVIGIVYSVIAPFILFFMLIIFGLFWIVYRYNTLYIYQFKNDTGGLLFPTAVNQLFVGIYFMEICLAGFFFISTGPDNKLACIPQGAIMIVVIVFTILYHWRLNSIFAPLFRYLPITLEDEAVIRDEEFARAQAAKEEHNQRKDLEALNTEAQDTVGDVGDVLFAGFADELEDLTPHERDLLVRYAFQHSALRAKRPVVWIPRDRLGVSDDEIKRAQRMSTVNEKTNIWISNEGTALDGKGKVVFRRTPPDFSNEDLITL
ncbi:hypothetical protein LTR56_022637 [Elasticomyces elasticus]|nr:hypothetical protein LTR22_026071 [Elasticomyces elasticus]KAK3621670.1 hypothetical protein LTR56_022637 [Elasticomyces elasticus]KAK4921882.1 hypothetical protein LTR49_010655 [Elasticomyces elasticus]KAK5740063.1 hypothetical protein LTS12_025072 [Elasticomyces elasticus]